MTTLPAYPDYRDSGVDWFGPMPAHWRVKPLWSMFQRIKDTGHPEETMLSVFRDYGVVEKGSRANLNVTADNRDIYQLVHPGWLVTNRMKAWQGSVGISTLRGIVSGHYICFAPRHNEDPRYLNWLFRSPSYTVGYYLISRGVRVGQAEIDNDDYRVMPVVLPPVGEQRAIADYLHRETGKIDTLIERQQSLIRVLQERRRALRVRAVTQGLHAGVPPRDDPRVGPIPSGWSVKRVKHYFRSLDGYRVPMAAEERADRRGAYPYYGASGVIDHVDGYLFDEPLVLVSEDGANLVLRSTPIAFVARGKYWVNNHAHVLRPLRRDAIEFWAARLDAVDVAPHISGSAQPKFTAEALMNLPIAVPDDDAECHEIAEHISKETAKIDALITKAQRFIELAKERRAALITAAVTGQIDLRGKAA